VVAAGGNLVPIKLVAPSSRVAGRRVRRGRGADQAGESRGGKAENGVAGKAAVKRNRLVKLTAGTRTIDRALESKARALAGFKAYITNIDNPAPEFVIGAYHQLWRIEKTFRMSKHGQRARPIQCRRRHWIGYADVRVMPTRCGNRLLGSRFPLRRSA
jgi:hypothetical protein